MTVRYRTAVPSDAERLAALFGECFRDTFGHLYDPKDLALFLDGHTAAHWRDQIDSDDFAVRLAEEADGVIGFIKLGPVKHPLEPTGKAVELRQLYMLAPWQGSSAAKELMDWLVAEARRRGASELYLSVFTQNHRARRFYARCGFEEIGPCVFMVGNQADEDVIMRLAL